MSEEFAALEVDRRPAKADRLQIKHFLIGKPLIVQRTMQSLHVKGYCEIGDWSEPIPAGNLGDPGEVVAILVRQVRVE